MMAGSSAGRNSNNKPCIDKRALGLGPKRPLPIEMMLCTRCGKGNDEARLLLCEACDLPSHTYCLEPPLSSVPKGEWRCPKCVSNEVKNAKFEFGFHDSNQRFTLEEFGVFADDFKEEYFGTMDVSHEQVEREFWTNLVTFDKTVAVKYGAALITSNVGSGFPRKGDLTFYKGVDAKERAHYANHAWNLNNLPVLRESVLSHINTGISGMMVPWVYVGMCFSTFCWHVEDHWTYSINYNHWGEKKIWYGVAGEDAEEFDRIVNESVPELFRELEPLLKYYGGVLFVGEQPDLLHHMTTAINPRFLIERGLKVYTVHQNAGEFVVTFPRAYHSGFNEGFNFAEAVNFAPPDWLQVMCRGCVACSSCC